MVISKLLALIKAKNDKRLPIKSIVAIHIDYANRPESGAEADYVEQWCVKLGIDFRKRVIGEVTRGVTSRDEYEKVSREIRYGFYHTCIADAKAQANMESLSLNDGTEPPFVQTEFGIIFGHHRGDVQENVISNMMR